MTEFTTIETGFGTETLRKSDKVFTFYETIFGDEASKKNLTFNNVGDARIADKINFTADLILMQPGQTQIADTLAFNEVIGNYGSVAIGYLFTQVMSQNIWTVSHGLNRYPSAVVLDGDSRVIIADIEHTDKNTFTVTVNPAISGKVIYV